MAPLPAEETSPPPGPGPRSLRPGWVLAVLALGVGLRLYHYLRNPSMWHDEAALVLNVLDKSFIDLLGPLRFSEASPPLVLWIEKGASLLLGDSTFALRLFPLLASLAALLGVFIVARRFLSPAAAFWLLLLFGCSDRLLWHCCEAKPYAIDVAVAVGLLLAFTGTSAWPLRRRLLLFASLSPGLIFLSYPACFLLGGVALALLPDVWESRRARGWLLYGLFLLAIGVSFLALLVGPIRAQRDETLLACWSDMFPDWGRPWTVPTWEGLRLVEVFRYALEPVGGVLFPLACVGAWTLRKAGHGKFLAVLVGPIALACLASLLHQYPFGATRVMVFAAPAALLLTAAGLPPTLVWLKERAAWCPLLLAGVVLFPVGQAVYRVGWPWPRFDSAGAAAFVRAHARPGEAVVGTAWEQEYYFRDCRGTFRYLPTAMGPGISQDEGELAAPGAWLLAVGNAEESRRYLADFQAAGAWSVQAGIAFERTTLYHLKKNLLPDFRRLGLAFLTPAGARRPAGD